MDDDQIAGLFQAMRTAYGSQWKHGPEAAGVWRRALHRYTTPEITAAIEAAMREYVNHPPTLPQFVKLLDSRKARHTTYLPAPQMSRALCIANVELVKVLAHERVRGVDKRQLDLLVQFKNALVEDLEGAPNEVWVQELREQLLAMALAGDREARAAELERARGTFCRRQGIKHQTREAA